MSTETKDALVPVTTGDARRDALLRALGFDKLSEGQRELALAISVQYDLDPMLRHVVMVDGKPYITRDGLLHVAHKSGDFDGIEVDQPVLDADGKYWRTTCRVYRRSFSRPFVYPGRYPATTGNVKYNEEMAIKVAEVMTLRRAFDVSAPVLEERWDGEMEDVQPQTQPTSLAERVAQRALAASGAPIQPETGASAPVDSIATPPEPETPETVTFAGIESTAEEVAEIESVVEALFKEAVVAEEEEEGEEPEVPAPAATFVSPKREGGLDTIDDATALEAFKVWARDHDKDLIRAAARELFPNLTGFAQLNAKELSVIQHEVHKQEIAKEEGAASARCGAKSPTSESLCTLDPGHTGVHRHGTRESWV